MVSDKWLHLKGNFVEFALKPCPWCRKTPQLLMPMHEDTWIWKIFCDCSVRSEAKVSIRKTAKKDIHAFSVKLNELVNKWNAENIFFPYEKKIINLMEIPTLEWEKVQWV
jgi:hypothetical protein